MKFFFQLYVVVFVIKIFVNRVVLLYNLFVIFLFEYIKCICTCFHAFNAIRKIFDYFLQTFC